MYICYVFIYENDIEKYVYCSLKAEKLHKDGARQRLETYHGGL